MKKAFSDFYDNHTGLFLSTVFLVGLLAGGLIAFEPGEAEPREAAAAAAPTVPIPQATTENILIPTPLPEQMNGTAEAVVSLPQDAVLLSNGWHWLAPAPILNFPSPLPDGSIPLLLDTGEVYFITAEGRITGQLQLPAFGGPDETHHLPVDFFPDQTVVSVLPDRVYAMRPDSGPLWEFPVELDPRADILHKYHSRDIEFLLDTNGVLYGYGPEDGLKWEFAIRNPLRDDFTGPVVGGNGRIYVADSGGIVYAFDSTGLLWSFDPGEDRRGASDVQLGPDGNLYYVAASLSNGHLVSLNPSGEVRWQTELNTFRFYNLPHFSASGEFVRVAEDFVESETGVMRSVAFPFAVDAFIEGEDRNDYVLTGNHLIQWELEPDGFREVRNTVVNFGETGRFIRPRVRVYPDGIIEFRVYQSERVRVIWANPDTGETRSYEHPWTQILFSSGTDLPEYLHCEQDLEELLLACSREVPGSAAPVWSLNIRGIEGIITGFPPPVNYADNRLVMVAGGVNLYSFEVAIP